MIGAPSCLAIIKDSTTAKIQISAGAPTGSFQYQVMVADSISNKFATLAATLIIYSCNPTGFEIVPKSIKLDVLGES